MTVRRHYYTPTTGMTQALAAPTGVGALLLLILQRMLVAPRTESLASVSQIESGELIAQRFRVQALLGRGGTGCAYCVRDETTGDAFALKLLDIPSDARRAQQAIENFEREFHSLVDLAHPRVVQASDYGVWNDRPFYILELLDGGDLLGLAPLPWQEVCSIAYDVCSALSLLHSRRLLHRDITPRNIRRTTDRKAKLLDFGLLTQMGEAGWLAGTPPFVAPEVLQRSALDARSDLFSLGCTLYFALTGRACFPAANFDRLMEVWRCNPAPPSSLTSGIPKAVDDLVMELISIDIASRPKSAAEVMDRLLPLLPSPPDDELSAARSYLSTPQLVGRRPTLAILRKFLQRCQRGHGTGVLIVGERGVGRSRMLDAFVIEAKLACTTPLRASARDAAAGPFGVAAALAADLLVADPGVARQALHDDPATFSTLFYEHADPGSAPKLELRLEPGAAPGERLAVQTALRAWLLRAARERTVAIAVDDVDQIDAESAAFLAAISREVSRERLMYVVTATTAACTDPTPALAVLEARATRVGLQPLSIEDTQALLASVFGEVPHLSLLTRRLYDLCSGRPRDCMALAQHLVDTGAVRYAGGSWTLPAELSEAVLPAHLEEAMQRRLDALPGFARELGLLLSLSALERLSRAHWTRLQGVSSAEIDRAIDDLLAAQLVVGTPLGYALSHPSLGQLFTSGVGVDQLERAHLQLAEIFEQMSAGVFAVVHHLLHAKQLERALVHIHRFGADPLLRIREINQAELTLGTDRTAKALALGLQTLEGFGRPPVELQVWRAMIAGMAARGGDAALYYRLCDVWLAQLQQDTGLTDYAQLSDELPVAERTKLALASAGARYQATQPAGRGLPPGDAVKQLVGYVIISIAVAVRTLDLQLQHSLPALLEPFAHFGPFVEAMLWNAQATRLNGQGKREQARALFVRVLERLEHVDPTELTYLDKVRAAIQQTISEIDASLGVQSEFTAHLDEDGRDPNQRVGAPYIKMVFALNRGDRRAAEQHRLDAEALSLQSKATPMFSTLGYELEAHAAARDLTGLKQVRTSIATMARRHAGWLPVQFVADAHYARACGNLAGALRALEALRDASEWQRASPWCLYARALEAELLVELQRPAEALRACEPALAHCERDGMHYLARQLGCALALALAAQGQFAAARERIAAVISALQSLGSTGVALVHAYEIAVRVELLACDPAEIARCTSRLAAHHDMRGSAAHSSAYERVLAETRRAGFAARGPLLDPGARDRTQHAEAPAFDLSRITEVIVEAEGREERARRAIEYLCVLTSSDQGHLFLTRDGHLECVASCGATTAPVDVFALARHAIGAERVVDSRVLLQASQETSLDLDGATQVWPESDAHTALPLRQIAGQASRTVGVAVLSRLDHAQVAPATMVANAIAELLVGPPRL